MTPLSKSGILTTTIISRSRGQLFLMIIYRTLKVAENPKEIDDM
jgi:hypothetical protein